MIDKNTGHDESVQRSCDSQLTRKEFLSSLVRRAALAGALIAAPKIVDTFLIPPAEARTSTIHLNDTNTSQDTNHFHDSHGTNSHSDSHHTGVHEDSHHTGAHSDTHHTDLHHDTEDDFG